MDRKIKKSETRRRLIEVALQLSSEKGFSHLSLREVAKGAELTPAAFYRHFPDMEQLGLALLDEVSLSLRRFLRDARTRVQRDRDSVQTSVNAFLEYINEHGHLFRLLLGERQSASPAFRKAIYSEIHQFADDLREDQERNSKLTKRPMPYPAYTAEAIVAVVFTVGAEALELSKQKQADVAHRLVEEIKMILRGSRVPPKK